MSWKAWFRSSRLGSVLESVNNYIKKSLCSVILPKKPHLYRKLINFSLFPLGQVSTSVTCSFSEKLCRDQAFKILMLLKNYKNNSIIIFNVCTITMLDNTYHDKVLRLLDFFFIRCHLSFFPMCVFNEL